MKDIEKVLQRANAEDKRIPQKVHNKIEYALKNLDTNEENKGIKSIIQTIKNSWIRKFATAITSIIIVLTGGVTVCAALRGSIDGKPVFEWISSGIKFSDEYSEYKEAVNGQKLKHGETTVELVSTIYDENYVLLEFDVHVSQEDKEYLRLGENMIEDEFIELKENESQKDLLIQEKEKGIKNIFYVGFNGNMENSIIVDGNSYCAGKLQTLTKISDYEYKLYQMYFLTQNMTKGNDEITLTFRNNVMRNQGDTGKNCGIANVPGNYRIFELDGKINVKASKKRISENTEIIIPEFNESRYKDMTQKVEKIRITPLHIIVTVSIQIDNIDSKNVNNMLNREAKVFDENGIELTSYTSELNENFVYKGKEIDEDDVYDIKSNATEKATMNISEIIIIERTENMNGLKIIPTISEQIWTKDSGNGTRQVELEALNIDLTKK